ncbi:MAG: PilZ domain-containing protein [Deltaproteobacteria bacterium]|nr:PilZ domain-containing protein [Deltaproteobacteria bacterium]
MINKVDRSPRKHLIYFTRIKSASGKDFTGRLVDVSIKGLKVVMKEKVVIGETYSFEISLPEEKRKDDQETIHCRGKAKWYKQHLNPEHITAGFEIEGINKEDKNMLSDLNKRE